MTQYRPFLLGLWLTTASVASAHPGHGLDGGSHQPVHYLFDPLHLGTIVGVLLLSIALVQVRRRLSIHTGPENV